MFSGISGLLIKLGMVNETIPNNFYVTNIKLLFQMKGLMLLLNLFFVISLQAQNNKIIQILNKINSTAIENANIFIEDKFITNSDSQGYFSINIKRSFSTVKITHVIYGNTVISKDIILNADKVYIDEKTNILEEVMISLKKKITKLIFPEKSILDFKGNGVSFPFDSEVAIYIPNDELLENYFIKKIIIKTARNQFIKNNNSKYVPFQVNLYSVDSLKGIPDKKIFIDNFFASRNKNEDFVTVDLSYISAIQFPKNGIFVVIGLFDEEYYNEMGYFERPSFKVVKRRKTSNFKEYHRMLINNQKGNWKEPMYSKISLQCFDFGLELLKN